MSKTRVVLLNGVGSAGKSSIARALQELAREPFLAASRRASGDHASKRIDAWLVAYAAVRGAFNLFALETSSPAEANRLVREVARYRAVVGSILTTSEPRASPPAG